VVASSSEAEGPSNAKGGPQQAVEKGGAVKQPTIAIDSSKLASGQTEEGKPSVPQPVIVPPKPSAAQPIVKSTYDPLLHCSRQETRLSQGRTASQRSTGRRGGKAQPITPPAT
jgi:hypothetical protein